MTLEEVKKRKKEAEKLQMADRPTAAGVILHKLFFDILKNIAAGTCEDYIDCAKEVTEYFNGSRL